MDCGQEAVFLFHVFFVICALKILTKMWTGGLVMRILKKITSVISSSKSVNCVKEAVFLLYVFFLSFKILTKKCGQWTKGAFLFHVFFLFVPFTILTQNVWTSGQVMKIQKKNSFSIMYTLI